MKTGISLVDLAKELERRSAAKTDYIAPAERLEMAVDPVAQTPLLKLVGGEQAFAVNSVAHNQIAEYAGIPMQYYRRMAAEAPALLASNVNRWLQDKAQANERRMIRTLDGNVRAVLSDKYRALENEDLAEAILPVLLDRKLLIMSCQVTETRLYIKASGPTIERDVPTGRRMGDGTHTIFDTVCPAISISNSEVGHGALSIETGVYTRACTNLALFGASMRKYHTGARAELSDDVYALLTDKTKRLTDAAVWSQTRDLVAAAFDEAKFEAIAKKLGQATEDRIVDSDPVGVIEVVGKRLNLTEGERKGVLSSLIECGDLTRYGVHAAITHYSQRVEDYDRATELERAGAKVIELPRNDWQEIVKAAA